MKFRLLCYFLQTYSLLNTLILLISTQLLEIRKQVHHTRYVIPNDQYADKTSHRDTVSFETSVHVDFSSPAEAATPADSATLKQAPEPPSCEIRLQGCVYRITHILLL